MLCPLNLNLARQSIGGLLVVAYPENAFLDDQKETSVSMHYHTPRFLLVAILYGYQQNEYFAMISMSKLTPKKAQNSSSEI